MLADFVSDDRLAASPDGKVFTRKRWSTPILDYRCALRDSVLGKGGGVGVAPAAHRCVAAASCAVDRPPPPPPAPRACDSTSTQTHTPALTHPHTRTHTWTCDVGRSARAGSSGRTACGPAGRPGGTTPQAEASHTGSSTWTTLWWSSHSCAASATQTLGGRRECAHPTPPRPSLPNGDPTAPRFARSARCNARARGSHRIARTRAATCKLPGVFTRKSHACVYL
jgi:hypothetical protein